MKNFRNMLKTFLLATALTSCEFMIVKQQQGIKMNDQDALKRKELVDKLLETEGEAISLYLGTIVQDRLVTFFEMKRLDKKVKRYYSFKREFDEELTPYHISSKSELDSSYINMLDVYFHRAKERQGNPYTIYAGPHFADDVFGTVKNTIYKLTEVEVKIGTNEDKPSTQRILIGATLGAMGAIYIYKNFIWKPSKPKKK